MAASRTPDDDENTGRPEPKPERLIFGAFVDELEKESGNSSRSWMDSTREKTGCTYT